MRYEVCGCVLDGLFFGVWIFGFLIWVGVLILGGQRVDLCEFLLSCLIVELFDYLVCLARGFVMCVYVLLVLWVW